ncbi:hypothetical protein BH09CHL1_BH09CHL1_14420 [soil metagenome]
MKFGRVIGIVVREDSQLRLTVTLESGGRVSSVRDTLVPVLDPTHDLDWHADQYTQETIGVELAEQGWEAFAQGDTPIPQPGIGQSSSYSVRNL